MEWTPIRPIDSDMNIYLIKQNGTDEIEILDVVEEKNIVSYQERKFKEFEEEVRRIFQLKKNDEDFLSVVHEPTRGGSSGHFGNGVLKGTFGVYATVRMKDSSYDTHLQRSLSWELKPTWQA